MCIRDRTIIDSIKKTLTDAKILENNRIANNDLNLMGLHLIYSFYYRCTGINDFKQNLDKRQRQNIAKYGISPIISDTVLKLLFNNDGTKKII